jgi:hypothetical protein
MKCNEIEEYRSPETLASASCIKATPYSPHNSKYLYIFNKLLITVILQTQNLPHALRFTVVGIVSGNERNVQ